MDVYTPGRIMAVCMAILLVLIFTVPFLYPFGTFSDLDGIAGSLDHGYAGTAVDPISVALYTIGDIFCHQSESRSFIINGSQTAFCQRDISIFAGLLVGLILSDKRMRVMYPFDRRAPAIGIMLILMAFAEWCYEQLMSMDMPILRFVTGVAAGLGLAMIVGYMIMSQYSRIMKRR